MSNEVPSPSEVLVLGTRGVGKTTLLTVLGMKFERMGVFGLSLVPRGQATMAYVRNSTRRLLFDHAFPAATDTQESQPFVWDVLANTTPLFRLSTLDCAGELISQLFSPDAAEASDTPPPLPSSTPNPAREALQGIAYRAKALCLVMAPRDLPGNRSERRLRDPKERRRFDEIDDLLYVVAHTSRFDGKRLVVALTQTDDPAVREEIARLGGPRGYCLEKCPAFTNSKRFHDAHVVAVAPVVMPTSQEGSNEGSIPDNFASLGLENLLVALGGAVGSPMAPLAEASRAVLTAEWIDSKALRSGDVADRLAAARRRKNAAAARRAASDAFLNLIGATPDVRMATDARLRGGEWQALRRWTAEEAIADRLARASASARPESLLKKTEAAAKSALAALPGYDNAPPDDLYLSAAWVARQAGVLPRLREERKKAVRAAMKRRDKAAAEAAFEGWTGIEDKRKLPAAESLRERIAKITPPLTPGQKAARRNLAIFAGLVVIGAGAGIAANVVQVECDFCHGKSFVPCKQCKGKGTVDCQNSSSFWKDGRHVAKCDDCGGDGRTGDGPVMQQGWDGQWYSTGQWSDGTTCGKCRGNGWTHRCPSCDGTGEAKCDKCLGELLVNCPKCKGRGTVAWIDRDKRVYDYDYDWDW